MTDDKVKEARTIVAANIKRLRKARDLGQTDVADGTGLSGSFISGVERTAANISLDNIAKIAHLLGVEPYVLLVPPKSSDEE